MTTRPSSPQTRVRHQQPQPLAGNTQAVIGDPRRDSQQERR
jgi:hypothetical protein